MGEGAAGGGWGWASTLAALKDRVGWGVARGRESEGTGESGVRKGTRRRDSRKKEGRQQDREADGVRERERGEEEERDSGASCCGGGAVHPDSLWYSSPGQVRVISCPSLFRKEDCSP